MTQFSISLRNKLAVLAHFSKKITSSDSNFLVLGFIVFKQLRHPTFSEASLLFPIGTFQPKVYIQHFRIELSQKKMLTHRGGRFIRESEINLTELPEFVDARYA